MKLFYGERMNYYNFHIGDYRRDTTHLSMLEHGAYRQLLDMYYLNETPLPKITQVVIRRLSARTQDEVNAVEIVLKEFFIETPDGYVHKRCDEDIAQYKSKVESNKVNGKLGGRPKKTQVVIDGLIIKTQVEPKITLTNNQEPITNNHIKSLGDKLAPIAKGKVLPIDWVLPKAWGEWAKNEKPDFSNEQIRLVSEVFKDHWLANANQANAKKSNWEATWRNWVRKQTTAPALKQNKTDWREGLQ